MLRSEPYSNTPNGCKEKNKQKHKHTPSKSGYFLRKPSKCVCLIHAHNLKVAGSNPAPATNLPPQKRPFRPVFIDDFSILVFRLRILRQGELPEKSRTETHTSTHTNDQVRVKETAPLRLLISALYF